MVCLIGSEYKKQNKIELCEPRLFGDYHFLSLPVIQKQIKSRGFDLEQKVVAPSDLVSSSKLKTVSDGYGKPFWLN